VEEIAEKFHIDRSTVAKILGNVKERIRSEIHNVEKRIHSIIDNGHKRIRSEIHNDGGERIDC